MGSWTAPPPRRFPARRESPAVAHARVGTNRPANVTFGAASGTLRREVRSLPRGTRTRRSAPRVLGEEPHQVGDHGPVGVHPVQRRAPRDASTQRTAACSSARGSAHPAPGARGAPAGRPRRSADRCRSGPRGRPRSPAPRGTPGRPRPARPRPAPPGHPAAPSGRPAPAGGCAARRAPARRGSARWRRRRARPASRSARAVSTAARAARTRRSARRSSSRSASRPSGPSGAGPPQLVAQPGARRAGREGDDVRDRRHRAARRAWTSCRRRRRG